ncbi:MAG: WbuC family cupin fold metalloprotein [Burkholderiales bacterium]|nr:WbuC family cupin fold metalloprotein [Burkholderiales bacterium]
MKAPLIIDQALLDHISIQAKASPRKRKNFNFHGSENDLSHRLLNAIELGTYIPPHRHLDLNKDESMVMVRGRMGAVFFDAAGNITVKTVLSAGGPIGAINIPTGIFHSLVALAPDTVFFEAKAGPYEQLTQEERAPWAPQEGEAGVAEYLAKLESLFS